VMPRDGAILGSALVGGRRCTGVLGSMGMFTEHCVVGRRPDAIGITVGDVVVMVV
jgi:hypothetical protein